jgi:hypothetical protein
VFVYFLALLLSFLIFSCSEHFGIVCSIGRDERREHLHNLRHLRSERRFGGPAARDEQLQIRRSTTNSGKRRTITTTTNNITHTKRRRAFFVSVHCVGGAHSLELFGREQRVRRATSPDLPKSHAHRVPVQHYTVLFFCLFCHLHVAGL